MGLKLRPIQATPFVHQGQRGYVLHDPLSLSERSLFLPRQLAPALVLCDGTRDLAGLRAALMIQFGLQVPLKTLGQLIDQLDEVYLLDNERATAVRKAAQNAYRQQPFRPPALAGTGYPADPDDLAAFFARFQAENPADERAPNDDANVRGVICPHIDYRRGGRVYAGLWQRAARAARQAELIVVLGTDHNGGGLVTPTRQHYATPWGVMPTCQEAVDALAQNLGEKEAFRHELFHRTEHSIELAVVWLHSVLGDQTPELVPILTGSFQRFIAGDQHPRHDAQLQAAAAALREIASGRRTLVIAAADLAHMGPAFDGPPLDDSRRAQLRRADDDLLEAICRGDVEDFWGQIKAEGNRRNICGLPPIYLALQVLGQTHGQITGYEICPADEANTSSVSVAGALLW